MSKRFFVGGLYVDYRRENITLQALTISEKALTVHLYRTWKNLDFDAMIKNVNSCHLLKSLQNIYYDQYSISDIICKKLDDRFIPIAMDNHTRCEMIETVKFWLPVISRSRESPFFKQCRFSHTCKNFQGEVIFYPPSDIFTGNVEAFSLAVYGAKNIIAKHTKKLKHV
ncbi:MAG: hypothetical protein IIA83_00380 [Thaumarchaeota archaeon]|nr:hypothetical protein [Nitrososphaerota archaeon]